MKSLHFVLLLVVYYLYFRAQRFNFIALYCQRAEYLSSHLSVRVWGSCKALATLLSHSTSCGLPLGCNFNHYNEQKIRFSSVIDTKDALSFCFLLVLVTVVNLKILRLIFGNNCSQLTDEILLEFKELLVKFCKMLQVLRLSL